MIPRITSFTIIIYSIIVYFFMIYLSLYHYVSESYFWYFKDTHNNTVYDFIVVGAGSAGSIIASKLSNTGEQVLLLEAGGMPPFLTDIPMIAPILQKSEYDWQYSTESQDDACKAMNNHSSTWPMGKILGGSSRLNYMVYVNGHPQDYLNWFPTYKDYTAEKSGSLHVQSVQWSSIFSDALIQGVQEMSHSVHDINKNPQPGFMKVQLTMKKGNRWSTDKVLNDVKTLTVLTNTLVHKVLFKGKKVNGVEFLKFNKMYRAFAKKGVIISAGAVGSPKILMLSGVGPKDHLKKHGIKVKADLPVGQNLIDHIVTGFDLVTLNISQPISLKDVLNPKSMFEYLVHGRGPWTFAGIEVTGTLHTSSVKDKSLPPDLQILALPGGISQDIGIVIRKTFGITDEIFKKYFAPLADKVAITIAPVLLHPKSNGYIKLRSTNPNDLPIINPKYLSSKDDVNIMIEGIQFIKKIIKTEAMQKIGATLYDKPFPGCENFKFDSHEYWECYIRHMTLTCYHPAGTCKMGEVVDHNFKVFNTSNLYVVDASIFPNLPSGNTNAGVVMLAEKFTRLILDNLKRRKSFDQCHLKDIFLQRYICTL